MVDGVVFNTTDGVGGAGVEHEIAQSATINVARTAHRIAMSVPSVCQTAVCLAPASSWEYFVASSSEARTPTSPAPRSGLRIAAAAGHARGVGRGVRRT